MDCIFCKIVKGEIPSETVYKDDKMIVFKDLHPEAPVHVLAIPAKHIESVCHLEPEDADILGHMMVKIPEVVEKLGLKERGVRVVTNCGREAGQSVFHIHFHILGGRSFSWPPG